MTRETLHHSMGWILREGEWKTILELCSQYLYNWNFFHLKYDNYVNIILSSFLLHKTMSLSSSHIIIFHRFWKKKIVYFHLQAYELQTLFSFKLRFTWLPFFNLIKTSILTKLTTLSLLSQKPVHFRPHLVTICTALKWEGVLCSLILIC